MSKDHDFNDKVDNVDKMLNMSLCLEDLAQEKKGWDLRELAEEAGLSGSTLYRITRSKNDPYPQTLMKLARALGIKKQYVILAISNSRDKYEDPAWYQEMKEEFFGEEDEDD